MERTPTPSRMVLNRALELFNKRPTWVELYSATIGPNGYARELFRGPSQFRFFEQQPEHTAILSLLDEIARVRFSHHLPSESMITVRLPLAIHNALKKEAGESQTSLNQIAIQHLLQPIQERKRIARGWNVINSAPAEFRSTCHDTPLVQG